MPILSNRFFSDVGKSTEVSPDSDLQVDKFESKIDNTSFSENDQVGTGLTTSDYFWNWR